MSTASFDDARFAAASRAYLAAGDALAAATADADVLALADAKALAGMNLSKVLVELGWTPPVRQRQNGLPAG